MGKHVTIKAMTRKHPTENHQEVVIHRTLTVTQEEAIPLDLIPARIAALRADRERLMADIEEINREIAELEQLLQQSTPGD